MGVLEEIKARLDATDPFWGPLWVGGKTTGSQAGSLGREVPQGWGLYRAPGGYREVSEHEVAFGEAESFTAADCAFIQQAPADVRYLLDRVRVLKEKLAEAQSAVRRSQPSDIGQPAAESADVIRDTGA